MIKRRLNNRFTGIYRTNDDIQNLKIRVVLKKIYSIIQIPKFEKIQSSTLNDEPSVDFVESVDLTWQKKIFSKTEIKYYAQKGNCVTESEKRYFDMIKENENLNEPHLIYTYINEDGYVSTELNDFQTFRKKKNYRKPGREYFHYEDRNKELFIESRLDEFTDKENGFVEMHILADLEPSILLFTIRYRKEDGLFLIYPDFNESSNSYYIEIDQNSKQIYTYYLENLSNLNMKILKKHRKEQCITQLVNETNEIKQKIVNFSRDVEYSTKPKCRILIFIEIVSAQNICYNNIHVQYKIHLPKFTKLSEGNLEGSTHSSFKTENKCHFGYGFNIMLDIDDEFSMMGIELKKIKITFNVISIDYFWSRERQEGTATLNLPLESMKNNFECNVQCLRFIKNGNYLNDMFERFFFGGIRNIDSEHIPDEVCNYYGNTTKTSCTLLIKYHKIRQNNDSCLINTQLNSIDDIIESYHKAKEKL